MEDLWAAASYEPRLLSLPFALAPVALMIVIAYAAAMRGAPVLRAFLLLHCAALLPYSVVMMLSPSIVSPAVAERLFRFAVSFIPLAAAAGTAFQLSLIRRYQRYRALALLGIASSLVWIVAGSVSSAAVGGTMRLAGFWYPHAGPWAWLALIHTCVLSAPGFLALAQAALRTPPSPEPGDPARSAGRGAQPWHERRQHRAALIANLVTYAGLVDVALAYGVGAFPLGWLLSGIGSLLVVRALVVEDLLRVRAVDTAAPLLVLHVAFAIALAWIALSLLPANLSWWTIATVIAIAFGGVRVMVATVSLINRGARRTESPLDRLLEQLVSRARTLIDDGAIAGLAIDIVQLGVGARPAVLLAAEEDWGWTTATGERLADERAPDPLLASWLVEHRGAQGGAALFADDLEAVPPDLRELVAALFHQHGARVLVPVRNADELLALVLMPATARPLRGTPLTFVERGAERLAEALAHARMARRAAASATLAREVQLAATVQAALLPGKGPHELGALTVVGSWRPATRCAGDFWGVYPLGPDRVLIAVGDVTGHGVASAMVTAAAAGALDVCARRGGAALALDEIVTALDTAVRRVGGGELAMTCFAGIIDCAARTITYVSCGHPVPYLCRRKDGGSFELQALVGRGNLLGTGVPVQPKEQQRALVPGDLLVWYTDGVIEALDPAGKPFGDRRLQQLLRRLEVPRATPLALHDVIQASIAAHRAGRALDDDETIVTAQVRP